MFWAAAVATVVLFAADVPAGGAVRSPADEQCGPPRLRPVGRYEQQADGSLRVSNSGAGVSARFRGREVSVLLRETPNNREYHGRYRVMIDGREVGTLATEKGRERYPLATGLSPGEHTVELVRRTEAFVSTGEIFGFEFGDDGELLSPSCEEPQRRILFLGDSVTAAFGVLGAGPLCDFRPEFEDFFSGYAGRVGEQLDAEVQTALWSGHGITRNNDGSTENLLPQLFERAVATDADSQWDHSQFSPDVVFLLAGANDFVPGVPDEDTFVSAYVRFLQRIHAVHPRAQVWIGLSPMMNDAWPQGQRQRTTARRYLERVAREGGARLLEFDEQREEDGVGCTWHPSVATHQKMAAKLLFALRSARSP